MNLRDKLKIYEQGKPAGKTGSATNLEKIGAEPLEFRGRRLWRFKKHYPCNEISAGLEHSRQDLAPFLKHHCISDFLKPSELLFVDLETTALSTGTGTYPFLTGLGRIEGGNFTVYMYFMDDYPAEPLILEHVLDYFHATRAVVSFNGSAFDLPLIKNRYRINRIYSFPVDLPHIDLLHPCRRVFKRLYSSCSLTSIEEKVLGFHRENDIPGWMIPDVYFCYIREGETDRIPLVVEHNSRDIYSMYQLLLVLNRIYENIENRDFANLERQSLLGMANHLFRVDPDIFMDVMDFIGDDVMEIRALFKKYSSALKRSGKTVEALSLWENNHTVLSLEELAKHFEHREKDFERAAGYVRIAQGFLEKGVFSSNGRPLIPSEHELLKQRFAHRMQRLRRKMDHPGTRR